MRWLPGSLTFDVSLPARTSRRLAVDRGSVLAHEKGVLAVVLPRDHHDTRPDAHA